MSECFCTREDLPQKGPRAAEVQAALKEKGIEVTEQEILAVRDILAKVDSGDLSIEQLKSGELPEEMLEHDYYNHLDYEFAKDICFK